MFKKAMITALILWTGQLMAIPTLTGKPTIVEPNLLDWGRDRAPSKADLSEPTSNRIHDFHADIKHCDLVISTSGNYHMVMTPYLYNEFLPMYPNLGTWFATTSPPISLDHLESGELTIGNLSSECLPTVAIGPKKVMDRLIDKDLIIGEPIPIIKNQGNVILVRKGNPKNIESVWDLGRDDVVVTSSNPFTEPGSFGNYSNSLYNIAKNEFNDVSAEILFNQVYNSEIRNKWVSGKRIHHREVPQRIADGDADATIIFYHLAKYIKDRFPDKFDIIPLGGSIEHPKPVPGNKVGTLYIARTTAAQSGKKGRYAHKVIKGFQSAEFTQLLEKHGLKRP